MQEEKKTISTDQAFPCCLIADTDGGILKKKEWDKVKLARKCNKIYMPNILTMSAYSTQEHLRARHTNTGDSEVLYFAHLQFTLKAYISIGLCPTRYQKILGDPSVLVKDHRVDSPLPLPPPPSPSMSTTLTLLSGFALKGS